ncbi:MAG: TIGR01777 family protein [Chloroflexi bacterium]|nr:TIGR01777 family protein [Chloroflexota bacterium]
MRVAITGGTGYVGSALRRLLEARGDEVIVVRRGRPADTAAMWDPARGWFASGALEGVDAVVHLSGASIAAQRWTASRRAELRSSRVDSTRVLVDHLRSLDRPPRVLVTASATGYYGNSGAAERTEAGPKGSGFLAELVADWEQEAERAAEVGVRVVHARIGPIIARDSELIRRILLPFRLGLGGSLGSGRQWFSWVSTEDVVRGIVFMIEQATLSGAVNLVAPRAATNREFTKALGRALRRPTLFPVPAFVLRAVFGRALADEAVLSDQRVVPAKLLAAGFEFTHPTVEHALDAAFARPARAPMTTGAL